MLYAIKVTLEQGQILVLEAVQFLLVQVQIQEVSQFLSVQMPDHMLLLTYKQ